MRSLRMCGALVLVGCLAADLMADAVVSVKLAGTSDSSVIVNPAVDDTFSVDVIINVSPESIISGEIRLAASASNVLQVLSGAYGPDWNASPSWALPMPVGIMNPNTNVFGTLTKDGPPPFYAPVPTTGQTRMATLDLKVVTGTAPGDYVLNTFDLALGDSVTYNNVPATAGADFVITVVAETAPVVTSAVSRKVHAAAGTFEVDLLTPLGAAPVAVESRSGGPTQVVVTFDKDIQGVGGLDVSDVGLASSGANAGTVTNVAIDGSTLTIDMTGASDQARTKISFPGIANANDAGLLVADTLCFGVLLTDVSGDTNTNIFDLLEVRSKLSQPVGAANFRSDVDANGSINIFDLLNARANLTHATGATCP